MVRVDDLPLKVEGLHGSVDLTHDVVRLALTPDTEVPLAPLDGGTTVGLLHCNYQMLRLWLLKSVTQCLVRDGFKVNKIFEKIFFAFLDETDHYTKDQIHLYPIPGP